VKFELATDKTPAGDQPEAIKKLLEGLKAGAEHQTLLGVTGSGKSVVAETSVLLKGSHGVQNIAIGPMIDGLLSKHSTNVSVVDDTEVLNMTDDILKTISFSPVTGKVEWKPITQVTRHDSPSSLRKITTTCGRNVTVTDNHNFYRLRNGELTLCRSDDVHIGDYLPLPRFFTGPRKPLNSVTLTNTLLSSGRNYFVNVMGDATVRSTVLATVPYQKRYRVERFDEGVALADCVAVLDPKVCATLEATASSGTMVIGLQQSITPRFLRFLGYFIAEGHATRNYVMLSTADKEIVDDVRSEALSRGMSFAHRHGTYDYQLSSAGWADTLTAWVGSHARSKRLPPFWTQLNDEQLATLLSAYFSADGGVDSGSVSAATISKGLASDLACALLRFGITARIRRKLNKVPGKTYRTETWILNIYGRTFLKIFETNIGFTLPRKQQALRDIIPDTANTNVDLVPLSGKLLKETRMLCGLHQHDVSDACGVERSYISMLESGRRLPSQKVAQALLTFFRSHDAKSKVNQLVTSLEFLTQLYWSPVARIEEVPGERYVYDFSVADNETFFADGIFVHNTYTVANIINAIQKPTLVIAHNKTLAAQLAQEYRDFFPNNAVHYFVSYYDYYQPEAYMPVSDTFIEKEAQINKEIDRLRHASTQALLTRSDVIIVASVSCIYGLGSPIEYEKVHKKIEKGFVINRADMLRLLVSMYFERTPADLTPGAFRAIGNTVEIMPTNEKVIFRLNFEGDAVSAITKIDATTRAIIDEPDTFYLFPAKHFVTPEAERARAIVDIKAELDEQLKKFKKEGKLLESERIKRRTEYDLAMIREIGYCNGIENYSRHFDGRSADEPPYSLLDYFPRKADGTPDFLTVIDESHVTIPQIGGMYAGDRARKETLVDYGFRLPSAKDNRPLKFDEFEKRVGQRIYTSATPGKYEYEKAETTPFKMVEQIIRPTGLVDPLIDVRPIVEKGDYPGQVKDFIAEAEKVIASGARVLTTVLTKQMAEDLAEFLEGKGMKTKYIHSDVETLERIEILTDFRKGVFDCLVGVNLLREGLDLPEVELVAILDADKAGFLRSETALIQTIGRAARNVNGRVVLYADEITPALEYAIGETNRRRDKQLAYNKEHGITPTTIKKEIKSIADQLRTVHEETINTLLTVDMELFMKNPKKVLKEKKSQMNEAVAILDFETAAIIRDEINILEETAAKNAKKVKKK